jgi:hypothetical protein
MSTQHPNEGAGDAAEGTSRPPRRGDAGSPVGSTLSIVLALLAVVVGFVILRSIRDDGGGGGAVVSDSTTTTIDLLATTTTAPASTTTVVVDTFGPATVVVANANRVNGSATQMTKTLQAAGFTMGEPTNATGGKLEVTQLYYVDTDPNALAVAETVARKMGLTAANIAPLVPPAPVEEGTVGTAGVLVMLGNDKAGQSLEQMVAPTTSAQPNVTVPAVAATTTTLAG